MSEERFHCANCGGTSTAVVAATLDERHPYVKCVDCSKRGPGIRHDVFDRKRWEEQKREAELQKAARAVTLR